MYIFPFLSHLTLLAANLIARVNLVAANFLHTTDLAMIHNKIIVLFKIKFTRRKILKFERLYVCKLIPYLTKYLVTYVTTQSLPGSS